MRSNKETNSSATSLHSQAAPSLLSENLVVSGTLQSQNEIQVDGNVIGNIRARKITVGSQGTVLGEVVAETVIVRGQVKGHIIANTIILAATARIEGVAASRYLSVEAGAKMDTRFYNIQELSDQLKSRSASLKGQLPEYQEILSVMAAE